MQTPRYGAKIRKKVESAINAKSTLYECKGCGKVKVKNISFSQWLCKACGKHYAGGAYTLQTPTGSVSERLLKEYAR